VTPQDDRWPAHACQKTFAASPNFGKPDGTFS